MTLSAVPSGLSSWAGVLATEKEVGKGPSEQEADAAFFTTWTYTWNINQSDPSGSDGAILRVPQSPDRESIRFNSPRTVGMPTA